MHPVQSVRPARRLISGLVAIALSIGGLLATSTTASATGTGLTWTAAPQTVTTAQNPSGIAISGDGTTMYQYVSGSSSYVYGNHSGSWVGTQLVGASMSSTLQGFVTDRTGQHVFLALSSMGSNSVLYYSSNYGASFSNLTAFSGTGKAASGLAISPDGKFLGMAVTFSDSQTHLQTLYFYLSGDNGATWSNFTPNSIANMYGNTIFITAADYSATGSVAVYFSYRVGMGTVTLTRHIYSASDSVSSGDTYSDITLTEPDAHASRWAFSPDGTRVYGVGSGGQNYGEFMLERASVGTSNTFSFTDATSRFDGSGLSNTGNYLSSIVVPNSNDLYVITAVSSAPYTNTLYASTDQGDTLVSKSGSVANAARVVSSDDGTHLLVMASSGGAPNSYVSSNSGSTWTSATVNVTTSASSSTPAYSADGSVAVIGTRSGMTPTTYFVSNDYGVTLSALNATAGLSGFWYVSYTPAISADGTKIAVIVAQSQCTQSSCSYVYKLRILSGTGFTTRVDTNLPNGFVMVSGMAANHDLSNIAIYDGGTGAQSQSPNGYIYLASIASNGAATFSSAIGAQKSWTGLTVSDHKLFQIDQATGDFYTTTIPSDVTTATIGSSSTIDAGVSATNASWSPISFSSDYTKGVITLIGSGPGGYVYKTTDGGATWSKISGGSLSNVGSAGISLDGNTIAYGVTSSYMKISTDGGSTYVNQTALGTNGVRWGTPVFFAPTNYSYALGALNLVNGTSILNFAFANPTISGLATTTGPTTGGTTVVINGDSLGGASAVTFGGASATINSHTANSLTVTTPSGSAGAVDVAVTTLGGTATSTGAFTYTAPQGQQLTSQTITFTQPSTMAVGDSNRSLSATSDSNLTVTLTSTTTGVCTVVSRALHAVSAGTCSITASQAGDSTYAAAQSITRTVTINAQQQQQQQLTSQTITFSQPHPMSVGDSDQALTATSDSNLTVTLTSTTTNVCTIISRAIHAVSAGTCSIAASQAGDSTYAAAQSSTKTITISAQQNQQQNQGPATPQSITFTQPSAMTVGDADQTLVATSDSGLSVTLTSTTTSVCRIVSGDLHAVSAGTCSITASQAGDSTYLNAQDVTRTVTISAAQGQQEQQFQMPTPPSPEQRQAAQENISRFVNRSESSESSSSTPATPTVNDFGTIGVVGVSQANLAKVAEELAKLPASALASTASIQEVINRVNDQIEAVSNISSTGASKASVNDFAALGIDAVTKNNLADVQAALAAAPASAKGDAASIQAVVVKVITEKVNAVTSVPAPASTDGASGVQSFALSALPKDATVTIAQPTQAVTVKLSGNSVKITPDSSFSGKVSVPVTVSQAGISKTITISTVVSPDEVHAASAVIAPIVVTKDSQKAISLKPTLSVALPKNATGYELLVNSKVVAVSKDGQISTDAVIKPTDVVQVVATGNDGTRSAPIPVTVSTTSTYVGSVNYLGRSASLAKSGQAFLSSVIKSTLDAGLSTITLTQYTKSGLSSAISSKQLAAITKYIATISNGKIKLNVVKGGKSTSSNVDVVVG